MLYLVNVDFDVDIRLGTIVDFGDEALCVLYADCQTSLLRK